MGSRRLAWAVAPALLVLIGLGTWQLQRWQWKEALIATIAARAAAAPVALSAVADPEGLEFTRVVVDGRFLHERERQVLAQVHKGAPGVGVVTPLRLDDGRVLMIDRGWLPEARRDHANRPQGQVKVEGLLRLPPATNWFSPTNRPDENVWYRIDPLAMAGPGAPALPYYLEASPSVAGGEAPVARHRVLALRNHHLQYALTWYGLAAALAVVFLLARRRDKRGAA